MGADYSQYNLNDQLQATESLASKSDYTTSTTFDAQFEGASAQQILSGRIKGVIIINDGTNDRVMIGKLD